MFSPFYYEKNLYTLLVSRVESGIEEIKKAVEVYLKKPVSTLEVLDVGSGKGDYSLEMVKHFKSVTGVEPYKPACNFAQSRIPQNQKNIKFIHSLIENYTSEKKFDLITSLATFEHLNNQKAAFDKIFSLLKNEGLIYLTAPNKYWLFEPHYNLPFLSWLPLSLANKYLKLFKGVNSYEDCSYAKSFSGMKHFFDQYPCHYKFILPFNVNGDFIGGGKKGFFWDNGKYWGLKI